MVGRLSPARQSEVVDLIRGLVARDTALVIDVLIGWTGDEALDNTEKLAIEIDSFLDSYHGLALKELNIAAMLTDIAVIMRDNELVMPPDLALLFKVFITLESLGRLLDPALLETCHVSPLSPGDFGQKRLEESHGIY